MGNTCQRGKKEESPKPVDRKKPDNKSKDEETSVSTETGGFAKNLLDAQNEYRVKHGAPPLKLDDGLSADAQKWADKLAKSGKLQHADSDDGENLAFASPDLTAKGAATMWYNEIKDYDFTKPGFTSGTGHFTQIVWAGSQYFGAGVATKENGGVFVVGRYRPAGNVTNPGYFEKHVLPAK